MSAAARPPTISPTTRTGVYVRSLICPKRPANPSFAACPLLANPERYDFRIETESLPTKRRYSRMVTHNGARSCAIPIATLRTPDERFADLLDWFYALTYTEDLEGYEGLRIHDVNVGAKNPKQRSPIIAASTNSRAINGITLRNHVQRRVLQRNSPRPVVPSTLVWTHMTTREPSKQWSHSRGGAKNTRLLMLPQFE